MDELMKVIADISSGKSQTHTFKGLSYTITVSSDPEKVIISDNFTGEKKRIFDLNPLEISLTALVSALADRNALELKEDNSDKES